MGMPACLAACLACLNLPVRLPAMQGNYFLVLAYRYTSLTRLVCVCVSEG